LYGKKQNQRTEQKIPHRLLQERQPLKKVASLLKKRKETAKEQATCTTRSSKTKPPDQSVNLRAAGQANLQVPNLQTNTC
jgi:shikimate kinase